MASKQTKTERAVQAIENDLDATAEDAAIASSESGVVAANPPDTPKKGHPRGFYVLFLMEMWERFGYYGLYNVLVLFTTTALGFPEEQAVALTAAFGALVYALVAVGGWIADRVLGQRRVMLFGLVELAIGYVMVSLSSTLGAYLLFLGLGFIAVGGGLFKSAPSSLLPQVYEKGDTQIDSAFTLYYMAINIGSLAATWIVPTVAKGPGWGVAFGLTVGGLAIAIAVFFLGRKEFNGKGSAPDMKPMNVKAFILSIVGSIICALFVSALLSAGDLTNLVMLVLVACVFVAYLVLSLKQQGIVRTRMLVALALMIEAIFFFVLYNQMSTSINLFSIHHVDCTIFGFSFEPVQIQSLNPLWILILSPLMAKFYTMVGNRFPLMYRFSTGMIVGGVAFGLLYISTLFANADYHVSSGWLVAAYMFQSMAELLISGLGLSLLAKLVPKDMLAFTMGAWFTVQAGSSLIAGYIANVAVAGAKGQEAAGSLAAYGGIFLVIAIISFIIGLIAMALAGKLQKAADIS